MWHNTNGESFPEWFQAMERAVVETFERADKHLNALHELSNLWVGPALFVVHHLSDDPPPLLECVTDAFVSLTLGTHCYYKAAATALRQQVELTLTAVLINNRPASREKYKKSNFEIPSAPERYGVFEFVAFQDYRRRLEEVEANTELVSAATVEHARELYKLLCHPTHSRGGTWNIGDWDYDPLPRFSPEAFDAWADAYEVTQRTTLLWDLLAYPPMFQWVNQNQPQDWGLAFHAFQIDYLCSLTGMST